MTDTKSHNASHVYPSVLSCQKTLEHNPLILCQDVVFVVVKIGVIHLVRTQNVLKNFSINIQASCQLLKVTIRTLVCNPAGIYLFKLNKKNTRTMCEVCSKLTIKTTKWRRSGVFIVNFEQISHTVLVFPFLTLNKKILSGKTSNNSQTWWAIGSIRYHYLYFISRHNNIYLSRRYCHHESIHFHDILP